MYYNPSYSPPPPKKKNPPCTALMTFAHFRPTIQQLIWVSEDCRIGLRVYRVWGTYSQGQNRGPRIQRKYHISKPTGMYGDCIKTMGSLKADVSLVFRGLGG